MEMTESAHAPLMHKSEQHEENNLEAIVITEWPDEDEDTPVRTGSKAHLWKKGQSGNPAGRPKGKTMKDYVRELMERMTDEERLKFLEGMPKEVIWRMAEGNPSEEKRVSITVPVPILGGATQAHLDAPARDTTPIQGLGAAALDAISEESTAPESEFSKGPPVAQG